jgi:hypothetical protein
MTTPQEILNDYWQLSERAERYVETLAREVLTKMPELDEFIMAMGTYFFTYKEGGENFDPIEQYMGKDYRYYTRDANEVVKPLNEFISEWDNRLHLTGHAMRFTVDGPVKTEW